MNAERAALGVGTGLALIGLAIVVVPDLAAGMGVARLFVAVAGLVAAILLLFDVRTLALSDVDQASPATVEDGVELPRAGTAVDDLLAEAARGYGQHTQERRDHLEARIRTAAIDVLARREDRTPAGVESMLVEGSWTDDPYAAAFLGAYEVEALPLRERVTAALRPEAKFAQRATHAIHAIADLESDARGSAGGGTDARGRDERGGDDGSPDGESGEREVTVR